MTLSKFIVLVILAALVGGAMSYVQNMPLAEGYISRTTVRLTRNGRTFCSGVVLSDNTIATAAHCTGFDLGPMGFIVDPAPIEIRRNDNLPTGIMAKPYEVSTQLDRAILKGDFHALPHSPYLYDVKKSIAARQSKLQFIICGYPMGGQLYCGRAKFLQNDNFQMMIKGILIPGMSGGPMYLPDGTVMSVNSAVQGDNSLVSPLYNQELAK